MSYLIVKDDSTNTNISYRIRMLLRSSSRFHTPTYTDTPKKVPMLINTLQKYNAVTCGGLCPILTALDKVITKCDQ